MQLESDIPEAPQADFREVFAAKSLEKMYQPFVSSSVGTVASCTMNSVASRFEPSRGTSSVLAFGFS